MFNAARHFHQAVQPLLFTALALPSRQRAAWLEELRADCPTVARELDRLVCSSGAAPAEGALGDAERLIVRGSPEDLGLR
jgi:hypothetical protein